ncbi:hypothetical protein D9V86_10865 [Bacteroidetes/Chlorobi group bacterium ChocPot_Mid]|nr:MAG: hypothetical protein D9V86_10865 [Bacteroidetes/Chlorobi group bacterium ChocPot_Mid]
MKKHKKIEVNMKYLFCFMFFVIITFDLQSQVKIIKYNVQELIITQTKYDTLLIKEITFVARFSDDVEYVPSAPDTLYKKGEIIFTNSKMDFNKVFSQAIITYIDPKTLEEKVQKLILNIKSEWINPFEETIRCQAITKKGTQCSRTTTDKSGNCWQHQGR